LAVLVTRPAPDNERSAEVLRALGFQVLLAPMLVFETLPFQCDAGFARGVLLTSANAVRAMIDHPAMLHLRALPVFAVGETTAIAARAAGFDDVRAAGGDAVSLLAMVTATVPPGEQPLTDDSLLPRAEEGVWSDDDPKDGAVFDGVDDGSLWFEPVGRVDRGARLKHLVGNVAEVVQDTSDMSPTAFTFIGGSAMTHPRLAPDKPLEHRNARYARIFSRTPGPDLGFRLAFSAVVRQRVGAQLADKLPSAPYILAGGS